MRARRFAMTCGRYVSFLPAEAIARIFGSATGGQHPEMRSSAVPERCAVA
jgi:hypothetical protein